MGLKKAREPVQKRSKAKKSKIIDAAYKLVEDVGYDDMNIRLIAQEAGVSVGTIYSYFDDKKSVFLELLKRYQQKILDYMSDAIEDSFTSDGTLEASFLSLILKTRDFLKSHQKFHKAIVILSLSDEGFGRNHLALEQDSSHVLANQLFQKLESKVQVNDREITTWIVHKTIDELIQYTLFYKPDINVERVFSEIAKMIAGYLSSQSS